MPGATGVMTERLKPTVESVIYEVIDAELVMKVAKEINGSGGSTTRKHKKHNILKNIWKRSTCLCRTECIANKKNM